MALPNLFIIGAAKCGTTSLHAYLAEHPEIFMSTPKELYLFSDDDWRNRLEWYRQMFPTDAPVRGESTPHYTLHPHRPHVPERIFSVAPSARFIYLVRDPMERVVSHWVQRRANGEPESFEQRVRSWRDQADPIVCGSLYATQVEEYLRYFDRSRMLVIDQEDLRARRRETLREVFSFIGVDAGFRSAAFDVERNTRDEKFARTRIGYPVWNRVVGPALRRLPARLRDPLAGRLIHLLLERVESPPVSEYVRRELEPVFSEEADRLRQLTGKAFASWSI